MEHKRFTLLNAASTILLLVLGLTGIQAQEAILTSGGDATGSNGRVSYSIGQVVYTTIIGSNGYVIQGVQPIEISGTTAIEKARGIDLAISAYPNPAIDILNLKIDVSTLLHIESMSYQIFDTNGKLLETKKLKGYQTSITMSQLIPATYFLKVRAGEKELKTFKIIKN